MGHVDLQVQAMAGIARSDFPYYKFIYEFASSNPKIYYAHEGERPKDYSFVWGMTIRLQFPLTERISLGMGGTYSASGFDFHFDPRSIPGGSGSVEYDDPLTYRALNTGITFSWLF